MTKARAEQLLAAAGPGGPWSAGEERTLSAYCAFARAVRGGDVTAGGLRAAGWADQAEATSALMQILAKRSHSTKRGGGAAGPKRGGGGFGEVRNLILLDTRSHRAALGTKAGDWLGVLAKHCAAEDCSTLCPHRDAAGRCTRHFLTKAFFPALEAARGMRACWNC